MQYLQCLHYVDFSLGPNSTKDCTITVFFYVPGIFYVSIFLYIILLMQLINCLVPVKPIQVVIF